MNLKEKYLDENGNYGQDHRRMKLSKNVEIKENIRMI